MFDVGFAELFLLSLIGLLVLGPERLPAVARTVGGFMRKARASWASLRSTIEAELAEADVSSPIKEAGKDLRKIASDLKSEMPDMNEQLDGKPGKTASSPTDSSASTSSPEDAGKGSLKEKASTDSGESSPSESSPAKQSNA